MARFLTDGLRAVALHLAIVLVVLTAGSAYANVPSSNLFPAKDVVVVYPASATSKEPLTLNFTAPVQESQPPVDVETPLGQVRAVLNTLHELCAKQAEILEQLEALNLRIDALYGDAGLEVPGASSSVRSPEDDSDRQVAPALPRGFNDSSPWRPIILFVITLAFLVLMNRVAKRLDDALAAAKKGRRGNFKAQPLE